MRFLGKDPESALHDAKYVEGGHNEVLRAELFAEQRGFCAYSEYFPGRLDTTAIEHFNPTKKATDADGYRNYYGVMQVINQRKRRRETEHAGAAFFDSLFFQDSAELSRRVAYVPGEMLYQEIDPADAEAAALVVYLGFNDHDLFEERRQHLLMLADLFSGWDEARKIKFLREHPKQLSFVTALAAELGLDAAALLA
jgi:hypothetical protein